MATLSSNDTAIEFGKNYCSAKGYGIDSVEVEFNYNPNLDCFVWLVSGFETDKENTDNTYIRTIEMNAESSEFISENSEQIITVY